MVLPNPELMSRLNIDGNKGFLLEDAYAKLTSVLDNPELYEKPVEQIEALEYIIQFLWGFGLDRNYHRYWKEVNGCVCPKLDNEDAIYRGRRIIDTTCKFHGIGEIK